MRVTVTQEDIDKGVSVEHDRCAVALALKRATGHESVSVTYADIKEPSAGLRIRLGSGSQNTFYVKSRKLYKFVSDFDNDREVAPFTFLLKGYNP